MYEIDFYADRKGNVPVREYIKELAGKKDKDSRIKLNKIRDYIRVLPGQARGDAWRAVYEENKR